jgi:hypothetical protein
MIRSVTATAAPHPSPAAPSAAAEGAPGERRPVSTLPWLLGGCLVLGLLSLLGPSEPTYDPWAWIIWGREITELDLNTLRGPSWKPLPVLLTTPFALAGDSAAPLLWLAVARAGGMLAIAMAYRLAARFGGRAAGLIAGGALLLADEYVRNFWRGNSEGLLVALCLWAVERHLDGRREHAFLLGFGAALLRPEVWPFFVLYGAWLAWKEPRTRLLVAACFVGNGVLWLAPEWWGSGDPMRAANRARQPNPDSPAFAESPFLEVFRRSSTILSIPVLAGAVVGVVAAARRPRPNVLLLLGLVAVVLMIAVALMTEAGFAGNLRYVALPAALVCVMAGAGWVWLVGQARARLGRPAGIALAVVLAAAAAPFVLRDADEFYVATTRIGVEAELYATVPKLIERAGGREAVKACGTVFTGPFQTQSVGWHLHMHSGDVQIRARPPGIVIAPNYERMTRDARFAESDRLGRWIVRRRCAA